MSALAQASPEKSSSGKKEKIINPEIVMGPALAGAVEIIREFATREQVTKFLDERAGILTGFFGAPFSGGGGGGGKSSKAHH